MATQRKVCNDNLSRNDTPEKERDCKENKDSGTPFQQCMPQFLDRGSYHANIGRSSATPDHVEDLIQRK